MTCQTSTFEIKKYCNHSLQKICDAAYKAVNEVVIPQYNYREGRNRKQSFFIKLWQSGPNCLFNEERYYPLVVARSLVIYYLRFYKSYGVKKAAKVFNQHHSTAIYSTQQVNNNLSLHYDNPIKDAWQLFVMELGQ